jgi:membrane protein implicated in regulation of membrane protease activity
VEALLSHSAYLWLALGAALIAVEAATVPGLGLFLGGLGALCTGIMVESGGVTDENAALQFACFFGFTTLWTALLWKPLMKFRQGSAQEKDREIGNVVGENAIVGEAGLKRGDTGQVRWSGTLVSAELDASADVEFLPAGSHVTITSGSGTTFTVKPKLLQAGNATPSSRS